MDRDLLRNTDEVVPTLGPLCSKAERENIKKINDSTLSKNIVSLTLKVIMVVRSFPLFLTRL